MKKLVVIVGPTATGKSDLGVVLAQNCSSLHQASGLVGQGEIISADSRQVYRGLDIGTGKITHKEMRGIPHHLLDVVDPQKQFSVAEYKILADTAIADIYTLEHIPFLVGGSGMYISAVVDDQTFPDVPPNETLRTELSQKSVAELFTLLEARDPERAKNIEAQNPRRLIRALEIVDALGTVPKQKEQELREDVCMIGLDMPDEELQKRITTRLQSRFENGMKEEAEALHAHGLSYERMHELGLEYHFLALLLKKELSKEECVTQLNTAIWHYAKRQRMWFKRDKRIHWFHPKDTNAIQDIVYAYLVEKRN